MGQITDDEAFRHIADSYRWLACAECSISDVRRSFDDDQRRTVAALLPNVDVALGASAVVYARALAEFYSPPRPDFPDDVRSSVHFAFAPVAGSHPDLDWILDRKRAMDAHLAHLTTHREYYEREGIDRVEWVGGPNGQPGAVHELVTRLVRLLEEMGRSAPDPVFRAQCQELVTLVEQRRVDRNARWEPSSWSLDGVP